MSWNSGVELYEVILETLKKHVSEEKVRMSIHVELIDLFEMYDCCTLFELLRVDCHDQDEAFRLAWEEVHGDEGDDD